MLFLLLNLCRVHENQEKETLDRPIWMPYTHKNEIILHEHSQRPSIFKPIKDECGQLELHFYEDTETNK